MSEKLLTAVMTILLAIVGIAMLTVLLSRSARTAAVVTAATDGLALQFRTLFGALNS